MKTIDTQDLKKLIDRDADFLLINTLSPDQSKKTEIPGSINIPQDNADFVDRVESEAVEKDKQIVVYCASEKCGSSEEAARKLEEAGFTNVYDYSGGAKAWTQSGELLVLEV